MDLSRVRELEEFARERDEPLLRVLVERGGADESQLLKGLAEALKLQFVDDVTHDIDNNVIKLISPSLALRHRVVPFEADNGSLAVLCSDPFEWRQWDELQHILGKRLRRVICPGKVVERLLKAKYGIGADTIERLVASKQASVQVGRAASRATDLSDEDAANEPTVVNLVNRIIGEAIRAQATDIHFEPYEEIYKVRYRIDGMLEDVSVPHSLNLLKLAVISRIKIMANLDITEKRLPQDGRAQVSMGGMDYDLRVSVLPGVFGEAVNLRLQTRQMVQLDLASLGFEAEAQAKVKRLISTPHGLVLVTGPTGSGKTTTLYTCLSRINQPQTKIITIEDPVEYWMEGIVQMQVHDEIGFTFARALRSILRHDPDVVLVGEIRDRETADIAIRASLTGHLVFATLHTNDAPSAVTRLIDIGVEPFLVATSVTGIIAQRLVRLLCPHCKRPVHADALADAPDTFEGGGCERCRFTGFRGRSVVSEVMDLTPEIRELVQRRETADHIKRIALQQGMSTLRESGVRMAKEGRTSLAEALRVTVEDI
jgi:general secretion pathway protein E